MWVPVALKKIRIKNIILGKLPIDKWRNLSFEDTQEMNRLLTASVKTEEKEVLENSFF